LFCVPDEFPVELNVACTDPGGDDAPDGELLVVPVGMFDGIVPCIEFEFVEAVFVGMLPVPGVTAVP
jgi:hypothetical protein